MFRGSLRQELDLQETAGSARAFIPVLGVSAHGSIRASELDIRFGCEAQLGAIPATNHVEMVAQTALSDANNSQEWSTNAW
jgi:hypothetical protein